MKDDRCHAFRFLVYPESAPVGWATVLRDVIQARCWISPLHDPDHVDEQALIVYKDIDPDSWECIMEQTRKQHYHGIVHFDNKKSYENFKEFLKPCGAVIPPKSQCLIRGNLQDAVQYLIHYNHRDRQQFPRGKDEILCFNGATVDRFFDLSGAELDDALTQLRTIVKKYQITEIYQLANLCDTHFPDLAHVLNGRSWFVMAKYIDSMRFSMRIGNVKDQVLVDVDDLN